MKINSVHPLVLATLLLSILWAVPLSAQLTWERVDQTADGPINRITVRSMIFAPDGTPVIVAGDGIYRIEEREIGNVPTLVGIHVDSNITVGTVQSWSDALYTVTQQAVYRSDDGGKTWSEQFRPGTPPPPYYDVLEADGDILVPNREENQLTVVDADGTVLRVETVPTGALKIRSTPSGNLYMVRTSGTGRFLKSEDLGRSWQPIAADGLDPDLVPTDLQTFDDSVMALRSGPELFFSGNGGESWYAAGVIAEETIYSLFMTVDGTLWAVHGNPAKMWEGLRLSTSGDTGRTWQVECTGLPSSQTYVDPEGRIYSRQRGEIVMKGECAAAWRRLPYGFRNVTVASIRSFDDVFYATLARVPDVSPDWASRPYDLYRSDNGGISWKWVAESDSREVMIDAMGNLYLQVDSVEHPSESRPYRTVGSNVWRSTDQGETWRWVFPSSSLQGNGGIPVKSELHSLIGGRVLLGFSSPNGTTGVALRLFSSTDSGSTFSELDGLADTTSFHAVGFTLHPDGSAIVAGSRRAGGAYNGNYVMLYSPTADERLEFNTPSISSVSMSPAGRLYGWNYARSYYSDDLGETWQDIPLPPESPATVGFEEKGGRLWLLSLHRLFVSDDLGMTWEEIERTTPWDINKTASYEEHIPAIVLDDGTILDSVHVDRVDPYFGTFSQYHYFTVARSTDGGRSWDYPVDGTIDRKSITAVARSTDGTVVVGTDNNGLYRMPAPSDVRDPIRIAPEDLYLAVYPNPIRGSGRVEFYLRTEGTATLILYDLLGRRVQTLYDGPGSQGFYPIAVDFSKLPAGPCFLRLQRGDEGRTVAVMVE